MIRPARGTDLPRLQDVERAAGEAFRSVGMSAVADDEPPSVETLREFVDDGRAWVTVDRAAGDDVAVAYLLLDVVDGAAHVEQVSVHPDHARRGLGGGLLDVAERWAATRGFTVLTLTTFADVPWNAPYYTRLGFAVVSDDEVGPGLRAVRMHERELGLDRWPRVCLRRPVRR